LAPARGMNGDQCARARGLPGSRAGHDLRDPVRPERSEARGHRSGGGDRRGRDLLGDAAPDRLPPARRTSARRAGGRRAREADRCPRRVRLCGHRRRAQRAPTRVASSESMSTPSSSGSVGSPRRAEPGTSSRGCRSCSASRVPPRSSTSPTAREAERLLDPVWTTVEELAEALLDRRELKGHHVDRMVPRSLGAGAAGAADLIGRRGPKTREPRRSSLRGSRRFARRAAPIRLRPCPPGSRSAPDPKPCGCRASPSGSSDGSRPS
jgi:hypothetical protein